MMRWLKAHVTRDMIRPLIYKVFTRGVLALFAAQLVRFFAPAHWAIAQSSNQALILAGLFLLGAVIAWLRLDGMYIPQFKLPRWKRTDPAFLFTFWISGTTRSSANCPSRPSRPGWPIPSIPPWQAIKAGGPLSSAPFWKVSSKKEHLNEYEPYSR